MMKRLLASFVIAFAVVAMGDAVFAGNLDLSGTLTPGGPQEPQVAIISTPNCTGAYVSFAVLYEVHTFTVDVGGAYSFTEPGSESAMYVYEGSFDPSLPADKCIAASNTNPLDLTVSLVPGTFYHLVVIEDTFAQDGLDFDITISGPGNVTDCVFVDDFEDGTVDWLVGAPDAMETGGNLVLAPPTNHARPEAVATSVDANCSECSISSVVQTTGGRGSKVWILAWYTDKKNNVELLLDERHDVVVLRQRVNRRIVRKQKAAVTIDPDTAYAVLMGFDGTQITVSIDGAPLIALEPKVAPTGVPGFRTKKATATVGSVCVH